MVLAAGGGFACLTQCSLSHLNCSTCTFCSNGIFLSSILVDKCKLVNTFFFVALVHLIVQLKSLTSKNSVQSNLAVKHFLTSSVVWNMKLVARYLRQECGRWLFYGRLLH